MKKTLISIAIASTALLSVGCSSTDTKEDAMKDMLAAAELKQEHAARLAEQKQEKAEGFVENLPEWYVKPPKNDEKGIYSVALGSSSDLENALRKSELQANYRLSTKIKNLISAEETMVGSSDSDYRFIINSFVDRVDMSNSEQVTRTIKVIDGKYHVFTMMLYPYSSLHSDMVKANSLRNSSQIDSAYERLMKRIKESKNSELEQVKISAAIENTNTDNKQQ